MSQNSRVLEDVSAIAQRMGVIQRQTEPASLQAEVERLRAENARLLSAAQAKLRVRISEKGAIQVSGIGKFPVTLYKSQWQRVLCPEIIAQIEALYPQAKDKE